MNEPLPIDPNCLVPQVRSRFYHVSSQLRIQLEMADAADSFARQQLFQVLAGHLAISLALDLPQAYVHLNRDQLNTLGLSFQDALELAKRNLLNDKHKLPKGIHFESVPEGFYFPSNPMGEHNASLILFTEAFSKLPLQGDPVVFMPHTHLFWVTGSEQNDALALLCGMTLQELESSPRNPITSIPFVLRGNHWRPWLPAPSDPCFHHVRELYVWNDSMLYEAQASLLRGVYEMKGQDLHVADYRPVVHRTASSSEHLSVSVWTETVPTILPKTDFVCLQRLLNRESLDRGEAQQPKFGESVFVPWEFVQKQLLDSDPLSTFPERYSAENFPSDHRWEQVKAEADRIPVELQSQLRMAKRPSTSGPPQSVGSVDTDGVSGAANASEPAARSLKTVFAIGCVLACSGIVALTLLIALVVFQDGWGSSRRTFQAGDTMQLMPSFRYQQPAESEFETGELGVPQQNTRTAFGPLPRMKPLPLQPLPAIKTRAMGRQEQGFAGMAMGDARGDQAPSGGVLVGLRLVKGREWGGAIRSIQPIYQVGSSYVIGSVLGPNQGIDQIQYLAKPGYVVGQIRAQVGLALNAIQVEFYPASDALPADAAPYKSTWFGSIGGSSYELVDPDLTDVGITEIDTVLESEIVSIQVVVGSNAPAQQAP